MLGRHLSSNTPTRPPSCLTGFGFAEVDCSAQYTYLHPPWILHFLMDLCIDSNRSPASVLCPPSLGSFQSSHTARSSRFENALVLSKRKCYICFDAGLNAKLDTCSLSFEVQVPLAQHACKQTGAALGRLMQHSSTQ